MAGQDSGNHSPLNSHNVFGCRLLFPLLPLEDGPLQLSAKSLFNATDAADGSDDDHATLDSYDLAK